MDYTQILIDLQNNIYYIGVGIIVTQGIIIGMLGGIILKIWKM